MYNLTCLTRQREKDIPVILPPDDELILDPYVAKGQQPGEEPLPEDSQGTLLNVDCTFILDLASHEMLLIAAAASEPVVDENAMTQLQTMGFPEIRCKKALLATGNSDPEAAMEWLFAHMEDPGQ